MEVRKVKFIDICAACEHAIFEGDNVLYLNGNYLCDEKCLIAFVGAKWVFAE